MKRFLRFQLSLRMVLALTIGLGVGMGIVVRRAHRQRAVVEWIEAHGGTVLYDRDVDVKGLEAFEITVLPPGSDRPAGWIPLPEAWKSWLGPHYEWSVVEVKILESIADDLSPLADLDELRRLSISKSPARKLPRTAAWGKLFNLRFVETSLESLEGVEKLSSLRDLMILDSQVRDLTPLAGLTELESLMVSESPISDLRPLAGLKNLQNLHVDSAQISDLAPLAGLEQLRQLALGSALVNDLSPLRSLEHLESLSLENAPVSDLTPLRNLEQLQSLSLGSELVSDLSPLKDLEQLRSLALGTAVVSDLSPLRNLKRLWYLDLRSAPVSDLTPVKDLEQLECLILGHPSVRDLSPLKSHKTLHELTLKGTGITSLEGLQELACFHSLDYLDVSHTEVHDLSPLADPGMALRGLIVAHTAVRDVSPLAILPLLDLLQIDHTRVASTRALRGRGAALTIACEGTRLEEIANLKTVHTFVELPGARFTCESRNRAAEDVLDDLAKELDLDLKIDRKDLVRAGVEMGEPICLEVRDVTREELLDVFAEAAGLRYEIVGRVLKIFPANSRAPAR